MILSGWRARSSFRNVQRLGPTYFCCTVRACTVAKAYPIRYAASKITSKFAAISGVSSKLRRSFTVQGVIEVSGYNVRVIDPVALGRLAQA